MGRTATDLFECVKPFPPVEQAAVIMEVRQRKIIRDGPGIESETGTEGARITPPFAGGQDIDGRNAQDGGSTGDGRSAHGAGGGAEKQTGSEGALLKGGQVRARGGTLQQSPRAVVDDPILWLGGPAIGPGGGDTNQIERTHLAAGGKTMMFGQEDARRSGCDEADEPGMSSG